MVIGNNNTLKQIYVCTHEVCTLSNITERSQTHILHTHNKMRQGNLRKSGKVGKFNRESHDEDENESR